MFFLCCYNFSHFSEHWRNKYLTSFMHNTSKTFMLTIILVKLSVIYLLQVIVNTKFGQSRSVPIALGYLNTSIYV